MVERLLINDLLDYKKTLTEHQWQDLRPGVQVSYLYQENDGGMSAALLHYDAGATVPGHQHLGFEHIFILHGSQRDANGFYPRGSLLIHSKNTEHEVVSDQGCLALAIWQKPVQFLTEN